MKIAFTFLRANQGPTIFLRRLQKSIIQQGLAKTTVNINPFYDIGLFANLDRSIYPKPYVLRLDGLYFDRDETLGNNDELNRSAFSSLAHASGVVFISEHSRKLYQAFFPGKVPVSTVVHNAIDIMKFSPDTPNLRSALGIANEAKVLVASAHWRKLKRLSSYIDVFEQLYLKDKTYHLLILGKGAKEDVGERLDHPNIRYSGEVNSEQLAQWYCTGDVYLFLSYFEACGNTNIEAMACGLPVVVNNIGGSHEPVTKANAGIVCECDEPYRYGDLVSTYAPPAPKLRPIIEAVETVFSNLNHFRQKIRRDTFSIETAAKEYVQFLEKIISK